MTTTKAKNREETRTGERASEATEPPWKVILHNDWHNPINRVVWRLWKTIPGMTMKRATSDYLGGAHKGAGGSRDLP
jgi:ATP-dependent Clp protease adaptor protein ClpS